MTAIIILGAAVGRTGPSPSLQRRARHGAALFDQARGDVLIPSGGLGPYPPTEAEAIATILRDAGILPDHIHVEPHSTSTYENLRNARRILRNLGPHDVIIITDQIHAPRAWLVGLVLGLEARVSCPSLTAMPWRTRWRRLRHEILAFPGYVIALPYWLWRDRSL